MSNTMPVTAGTARHHLPFVRRREQRSKDARANMTANGAVCVANIGVRERRRRYLFGLQATGAGVLLAIALIGLHADPWWRLVLFLPFSAGATGYFQARDKT